MASIGTWQLINVTMSQMLSVSKWHICSLYSNNIYVIYVHDMQIAQILPLGYKSSIYSQWLHTNKLIKLFENWILFLLRKQSSIFSFPFSKSSSSLMESIQVHSPTWNPFKIILPRGICFKATLSSHMEIIIKSYHTLIHSFYICSYIYWSYHRFHTLTTQTLPFTLLSP